MAKTTSYTDMNVEELAKALTTKQQELVDATRSHKAGDLANQRVLGEMRKEIARIKTAQRANELKESK